MSVALRALAVGIAFLLLGNNIAAAKGNVPVIVTMIAIAFLPLLFERTARGGVLVVAFVVLWATVLPAAIERAGAQSLAHLEEREKHDEQGADLAALQKKARAECADGLGPRCRGLLAVLEQAQGEQPSVEAPLPSGMEMLSLVLGLEDPHLLAKVLSLANALGSELAIAALIHFGVFWRERENRPQVRAPPADAGAFIAEWLDLHSEVVAADLYDAYMQEWATRGARAMSRARFLNKLQDAAYQRGWRKRMVRGRIVYGK